MEKIHITVDRQSIIENLRTKRKAVAPGAITNPIARMRPAADSIAIIVNERAVSIPKCSKLTLSPDVRAWIGSKL